MSQDMSEAQMVGLVRNALLVAGYEMGQTGDHWPVINATIHSIAKDWEESKILRNTDAELKIHLYQSLNIMEEELVNCDDETRAELTPKFKELREVYDSYFAPLAEGVAVAVTDEHMPAHIKRAKIILETLGDEHA